MLNENSRVPFDQKPDAVIMLGKTGSGKTTLRNQLDLTDKYTIVDADKIMESLPGYKPDLAGAYHERAADIAEKYLVNQAIGQNMNMVLDMTGRSASKMLTLADNLHELGYNVHVVHAHVPDIVAGQRAYARWQNGGRLVPIDFVVHQFGDRPSNAFKLLKEYYAATAREYDTSTKQQLTKSIRSCGKLAGQLGRRHSTGDSRFIRGTSQSEVTKGGPGSGRYPAGSGDQKPSFEWTKNKQENIANAKSYIEGLGLPIKVNVVDRKNNKDEPTVHVPGAADKDSVDLNSNATFWNDPAGTTEAKAASGWWWQVAEAALVRFPSGN